jgi:hypothetical protein
MERLMRAAIFAVLVSSTLVSGCFESTPTFDTSSKAAFDDSLKKVRKNLTADQGEKLTAALLSLTFANAVAEGGFLNLAKATGEPYEMIRNRPEIHGKTAEQVIAAGDAAAEQRRQRQLARIDEEVASLSQLIIVAEKNAAESAVALAAIKISDARYHWPPDRYLRKPIISFKIENNGAIPLKRAYFRGLLETPGRAVPWVDDVFNYQIAGGLEPGERKSLDLAPNSYGEWGSSELQDKKGMVLTVTLTDIEGPDGTRLVGNPTETADEMKKRLESLQTQRQELLLQARSRPSN